MRKTMNSWEENLWEAWAGREVLPEGNLYQAVNEESLETRKEHGVLEVIALEHFFWWWPYFTSCEWVTRKYSTVLLQDSIKSTRTQLVLISEGCCLAEAQDHFSVVFEGYVIYMNYSKCAHSVWLLSQEGREGICYISHFLKAIS